MQPKKKKKDSGKEDNVVIAREDFLFPPTGIREHLWGGDHVNPISCIEMILSWAVDPASATPHTSLLSYSSPLSPEGVVLPTKRDGIQLGTPIGRLWTVSVLSKAPLTLSFFLFQIKKKKMKSGHRAVLTFLVPFYTSRSWSSNFSLTC